MAGNWKPWWLIIPPAISSKFIWQILKHEKQEILSTMGMAKDTATEIASKLAFQKKKKCEKQI